MIMAYLRQIGFFLLSTLWIATCLNCEIPNYSNLRVDKVEIEFENQAGESANVASVKKRLKTKEGDLFSQTYFDEDLKALSKEFDRVEPSIDQVGQRVEIKLKLWLKPTIRSIVWKGNKSVKTDKLQSELGVKPKMVYDRQSFIKSFHKVKSYYVRKGYFEAECDYSIEPTSLANQVDVIIKIKEGRAGKIKKINFHNFTKDEKDDITELTFTKEYSFWTSWFTQTGVHQQETIRQDQLLIVNYLQNKGYADAKVDIRVLNAKEPNRIIIDITVDKGPLYHFGDISIEGNRLFSRTELEKAMGVKSGDVYSPDKVRDATKAITDLYGAKGYIEAYVNQQVRLAEKTNTYNAIFRIEEGDRFRVGLIRVFGNRYTDTSVILHEALLVPGEVFNQDLLKKTEERLQNIGYFKNVNVYAVRTDRGGAANAYFRDVHIEVEETNTGSFGLFFGYSTAESVYGGGRISESNFNYKGFKDLFSKGYRALRGGGENVSLDTTIGTKQLSYTFSWTKPYFMDTPWIVGFDLHKSRNGYAANDYSIRSYGGQLEARYPINPFLKFGWHYRLNHSFIKLKHLHHHNPKNRELIRESKNGGLISATGVGLYYDSTDSIRAPTQGIRSSLSTEYAGLGGDHHFANFGYINSLYYSPYTKGVFKFRGDLRFIKTLGETKAKNLPLDERFFLGGETTIRGYRFNLVGPRFKDERRTPRGGLSSVLISAEFNQYLAKKFDGFVFFDAGNVYFEQLHIGKLRYSVGYGLKIRVFDHMPPVVLGLGYPLNPRNKRDTKHFYFSLGASF